jgi:hypothetical protein
MLRLAHGIGVSFRDLASHLMAVGSAVSTYVGVSTGATSRGAELMDLSDRQRLAGTDAHDPNGSGREMCPSAPPSLRQGEIRVNGLGASPSATLPVARRRILAADALETRVSPTAREVTTKI